ncbi:unnamed protein product [Brassica oleracea]
MRVMSWYMPDEQRNPIQEYQVAHIIPGALFFDLDGISDRTTSEAFSAGCSALGIIDNNDGVVVYDGKGMFSAARVWWKFRVSGHEKVWVLDGGLPRWRALGNAILKASAASEAIKKIYQGQIVSPVTFKTKFQPHLVWTLDQVGKPFYIKLKNHFHNLNFYKAVLRSLGLSLDKPIMASSGTVVTACIRQFWASSAGGN